jgi:3-deoxy-D-manno-octulosonate 8-phosphate phosphatase (KDO 8-P phosphatase)
MSSARFIKRCRVVRLLMSDVDGVLTDGAVTYAAGGAETKQFHVRDGLGVGLAHRVGLRTGVLSGRRSDVVARRAEELGMAFVIQGVSDKLAALCELLQKENLRLEHVAFMGDDLLDIPVMDAVALSAAPADAPKEVRARAHFVSGAMGGRGCLREFIEEILHARGEWERAMAALGIAPDSGL